MKRCFTCFTYAHKLVNVLLFIAFLLLSQFVSAQNPISGNQGFQILTEGNFTSTGGHHIHGPLAIGGNFIINSSAGEINMDAAGSYVFPGDGSTTTGLLVKGSITWTNSFVRVLNGKYIHIGNSTGSISGDNGVNQSTQVYPTGTLYNNAKRIEGTIDQTPSPAVFQTVGFDFTTLFANYRANSTTLSGKTNNVQLYNSNNVAISGNNVTSSQSVRINTLITGINYLNLTASSLTNISEMVFNDQPSASKVLIINVPISANYTWNNVNMAGLSGSSNGSYVIWNFYGSTSYNLTINQAALIIGTIYAPNMNLIKLGTGDIEGNIMAKTAQLGSGEVHNYQFDSNLSSCTPPNLTATTSPACLGGIIHLNAESTTSGVTYSWTGPNSYTSTEQYPCITPAQLTDAGNYTVTATKSGCTSSVTLNVVINNQTPPPPPTVANVYKCAAGTATITATGCIGTINWYDMYWNYLGNGSSYTTPSLSQNTLYLVECQGSICTSDKANVYVIFQNTPSTIISGTTSICNGESTTLTASCDALQAPNLMINEGFELNGDAPWWYETGAGVVTSNFRTGGKAAQITGNNLGMGITISNLKPNTSYTATCYLKGSTTGQGVDFYATDFGGANVVSGTTLTTGYVQKTITFTTGATNTSVSLGLWKWGGTATIYADDFTLTETSPSCSFSWSPGGATTQSITVNPISNTTYTVTTGYNGCNVTASSTVAVSGTAISVNSATICSGQSATLTATGCTGTVSWSNGVTANSITVSPTTTTNYTASCTPTNSNLLSNPNFEVGSTLTSWSNWGNTTVTSVSAERQNGTYGAKTNATSTAGGFGQDVAAVAGEIFTATAWGKVNAATPWSAFGIKFLNSSFAQIGSVTEVEINATSFQQYTLTATAPAGTAWVEVYGWSNAGAILYLDNFILTKTTCTTSAVGTVTVLTTPNPTTTGGSRCGTGTVNLSASGCTGTYNWYSVATGGTSLASTPTYTTVSISTTTTYYVDCTISNCASSRVSVIATVNNIPSSPATTGGSICGPGTVTLSAAGCTGTYNWYSVATGGTSLASTSSYITSNISSTTTYYVDCTLSTCVSSRVSVIATVNNIPLDPTSSGGSRCGTGTVTMSAAGCTGTYKWYNVATGGTVLSSTASYTTPSLSTTTNYYVSCTNGSCVSSRTTVAATVNTIPTATASSNSPIIVGGTLNLFSTGSGNYAWAGPNGFVSSQQNSSTQEVFASAAGIYTVTVTSNGCSATATTEVMMLNYDPGDIDCSIIPILNFTNPTLISGTALANGAKYRFSNVTSGTDAIVTIVSRSHANIAIVDIDLPASSYGGYDAAFQPMIDYNWILGGGSFDTPGEKSITFKFDFVNAGTSTPKAIPNLLATGLDIDGSGDEVREFMQTSGYQSYQTQSPTSLTLSGALKAKGPLTTYAGINELALDAMISFGYINSSSITVTYGGDWNGSTAGFADIAPGNSDEKRLNSLYFKCYNFNTTVCAVPLAAPSTTGNSRCGNGSVTLSASGCTGTYYWYTANTGGLAIGSGSSFNTPSISNTTTYYVECNAVGCTSPRASATATVISNPTVTIIGDIECVGSTIVLGATGGGTYAWTGPNSFVSTLQNPTRVNATTAMAGIYTLTVTANGCSTIATTNVTVSANPTPTITGTTTICNGQVTTLTAAGGNYYVWGDGSTSVEITVSPTSNTTYTATVYQNNVTSTNLITNVTNFNVSNFNYINSVNSYADASSLFDNIDNTGGATFHASRVTNGLDWGIGYNLGGSFLINNLSVDRRNDCCTDRGEGGVMQVWRNGAIVYQSNIFNSTGDGILAATPAPNVVGDEVRYVFLAGVNTLNGDNTLNFAEWIIGGTKLCSAVATKNVIINAIPASPTSAGNSRCGTGTVVLSASGCSGGTISWYSALTGGSALTTGATYTTPSLSNTTTYYLECSQNSCVSSTRNSAVATVNTIPTASATGDTECVGSTISLISSGGNTYSWVGPNSFTSNTQSPTIANGQVANAGIYTVTVTSSAGCSATATANVVVNIIPAFPTSAGNSRCGTGTVVLSASGCLGGTISWYSTLTGGSALATGVTYTTPSLSNTTTYYLECSQNSCVSSTRNSAVATVNTIPTASAASNTPIIGGTLNLYATGGGTYSWTGPNGFTSTLKDESISPVTSNMANIYTVTVNVSGCTATATTEISLMTNDPGNIDCSLIPTLNFTSPTLISGTAGANNAQYRFSNVTGGTDAIVTIVSRSHANIAIIDLDIPSASYGGYDAAMQPIIDYNWINGDGTFNVAGERSVTFKIDFVVTGTTTPKLMPNFIASGIDVDGSGDEVREFIQTSGYQSHQIQTPTSLTLSGALKAKGSYANYAGINELALDAVISYAFVNTSSITITYGAEWNGSTANFADNVNPTMSDERRLNSLYFKCENLNTTVCDAVLAAPTVTPASRCGTGTVTLSASGCSGIYLWYNAATGGTSIGSTNTFTTPSITSSTTYFVECNAVGCQSSRTSVIATVYTIPSAPTVSSNSICGPGVVILSGSNCTGGTVTWFNSQSGGTAIGTGSSFTTPNLTSSAVYFASCTNVNSCISTTRNFGVATINAIPVATLTAINSLCLGNQASNNGKLLLSKFETSSFFSYNTGSTYNSGTASAFVAIPADGILLNSISDPNPSITYSIRIKNASNCTIDLYATFTNKCAQCPAGYCEPANVIKTK